RAGFRCKRRHHRRPFHSRCVSLRRNCGVRLTRERWRREPGEEIRGNASSRRTLLAGRSQPLGALLCRDPQRFWPASSMIAGVIIRSAAREDFEPLSALYQRSVRSNPDGFVQDLSFHGCLTCKAREWCLRGGGLYVAIAGGAVIGLGALAP